MIVKACRCLAVTIGVRILLEVDIWSANCPRQVSGDCRIAGRWRVGVIQVGSLRYWGIACHATLPYL